MGLCACVKEREMERETHLLQTGGVELRLIDDLYSHLGAKKSVCQFVITLCCNTCYYEAS